MKQIASITVSDLSEMSQQMYDGLVKAVVDIEKTLVVVDAPMHYDEEQFLLEKGFKQYDLWGINLYPADYGTDNFIEYDAMINVRSSQGNQSRSVEHPLIQQSYVMLRQALRDVTYRQSTTIGHFTYVDIGTDTFPELLEELVS